MWLGRNVATVRAGINEEFVAILFILGYRQSRLFGHNKICPVKSKDRVLQVALFYTTLHEGATSPALILEQIVSEIEFFGFLNSYFSAFLLPQEVSKC